MRVEKKEVYTHLDKGGTYTIVCKTEIKIEGVWIPGFVYKRDDSDRMYTRSEKSFNENFRKWG